MYDLYMRGWVLKTLGLYPILNLYTVRPYKVKTILKSILNRFKMGLSDKKILAVKLLRVHILHYIALHRLNSFFTRLDA